MVYEKEVYYSFLLKMFGKYYPEISGKLLEEGVFAPLTGRSIAMSTNELLSFYMLLCDLFGKKMALHNIYSFWSVDAIAMWLMENEDDDSHSVIRRELAI